MVLFCHPFVEIKTPLVGPELVRVVLSENALLLTDLLYDRGNIIFREYPGTFQHMEDLVAPHSLINAAVFFKTDAVWMFLDFTAIGDQETVIFQEVVDPQVRDVPQVGNTFCGEEAPQLIVSAEDIPFREIFLFDFRFVMSLKESEVIVLNPAQLVVSPYSALNSVEIALETTHLKPRFIISSDTTSWNRKRSLSICFSMCQCPQSHAL